MISPAGHNQFELYTYIEYVGEERCDTLAYRCSSYEINDVLGYLFAFLLLEKVTSIKIQPKSPQFEEVYQPGTEGFQTCIRQTVTLTSWPCGQSEH
jgi:hypothetical protein